MELPKSYEPAKYEADIYKMWEDSGAFKPTSSQESRVDHSTGSVQASREISTNDSQLTTHNSIPDREPFSVIMPPPNANGDLHTGHVMYVVEDIMARYHRMKGDPTLWLPGADHAGIETQVVYERELAKEGKSRFDLGREQFYQSALAFTKKNMANVTAQLRSLGFSVDWSRFKFTLDDDIVRTVYETFKQMHDDGLIYRGNRIVNWCPHCRSGFSDLEIKYREQIDPLYYIKYGPFILATVRPETKFGDTAIAVNPKDERYTQYIGQEIEAEGLLGKFKLKVIADDFVDPAFGTGVVKVTPAHDPNDWEMGLRHDLEVKQAIGTDGLLTNLTGKYAGMPVAEAREQVAHDLEERGLIDHVEMDYKHSVSFHDRCGTLIEPLVTEQWWLKVAELKQPAIKAVKDGEIKIVPKRYEKVYLDWMENLRDWNISRQNWFGITIPIYYNASSDTTKKPYIIAFNEDEAIDYYGKNNYETETDTFDTWFSSGQWPYATLMATGDFEQFYPTSVMATARDIIFLWVSRMVMFSYYRFKLPPFKTVYLWGMVNDAQGKKMSKSKGNVINPLEYTATYGTDALRLALTIGITPGNNGSLGKEKIEGYRNFCNKLWNVARFILAKLPADYTPAEPQLNAPADHWIKYQLDQAVQNVTKAIDSYRFSEAGQMVYALLWDDFADWYVEASKISPNHDLLVYGLETVLKLLHPTAPFVTEAIWQNMPWQKADLIVSPWPESDSNNSANISLVEDFNRIQETTLQIRAIATEEKLDRPTILTTEPKLVQYADLIKHLARVTEIKLVEQGSGLYLGSSAPAWIQADDALISARKARLSKMRADKQAYLDSLDARLANERYVSSAPASVVQETRDSQVEAKLLLSKLDEQIQAISQAQK